MGERGGMVVIDERLLNDPEFLQEAVTLLKREITQLKVYLAKFGGHIKNCPARYSSERRCEPQCGYEQAKERWE